MSDEAAATAGGTPTAATTDTTQTTPNPAPSTEAGQSQERVAPDAGKGQEKDGTAAAEKDAPKPEQSKAERRIGALTAKLRESQRDLQRNQDLLRKIGAARQLNPLDFKSDAEYHAALIQDTVSQTQAAHAKADVQHVTREMARAENEIWDTSVEEYSATVPDFETVVFSDAVKIPGNVMREMRTTPGGPAVAYYLAKNQGEAARVAQLPKAEALIELGRLAGRLTATQPKRVTTAANPPQTVTGGAAAHGFNPETASMEEYANRYRQRGKSI